MDSRVLPGAKKPGGVTVSTTPASRCRAGASSLARLTHHGAARVQGDNFLSIIVPMTESSQAYKNNGAIIIWWDETEGGDDAAHTLEEIVISPLAKGNAYTNDFLYTHSSDLLTMERLFGVSQCLGDSYQATDLSDLFMPG